MSFTRKHYEEVARIIQTQRMRSDMMRTMDGNARDNAHSATGIAYAAKAIQVELRNLFAADNPRFDAARFDAACQPSMTARSAPLSIWPDVPLSTGRIMQHKREANGAQFVTPDRGPSEMTQSEWDEYCAIIRNPNFKRGD